MNKLNCFLIMFMTVLLCIMPAQAADPTITFIAPTEANNTEIYVDHTLINTTSTGTNTTALLNWNNSLVGWWRMNEGSGNVVEDFSGYGNNGSFTDGVTGNWTTDGKFGGAWTGNGVNDYVNCGNDESLNITDAITISSWVKINDNTIPYQVILDKRPQNMEYNYYFRLDSGYLRFSFYNGGYISTVDTTFCLQNDTYYHCAVTYDRNYVRLYVNGNEVKNSSQNLPMITNTGDVMIGYHQYHSSSYFGGSIDETQIHSRALNPDEINASYNASANRLFNNFTGLDDGEYNYTAYVQDEDGNVNSTETRYLTVDTTTPTITLLSQTPTILYQNSSGTITQVWGISHGAGGLNNSSIAYTFGMYDVIDDIYKFNLRTPSNNLADLCPYCEKDILRGYNRNQTLTWENNATITGGDIYTWNGYDYYNSEITFQVVNSTYTNVTVSGLVRNQVFPVSTYLDASDLKEAPKTVFPIHKTSSLIVKFCDNEAFLDHTHLGFAYVDAIITGALPTTANNIEIFYLNESFDPAGVVHPDDSPYLFYLTSMNASEWLVNDYSPHTNSSYVNSIVVNSSTIENAGINVTGEAYLYFRSSTSSSKSYGINMTNVASSTNVSFADSKTMWKVIDTPFSITQESYTPNIFTSFMHGNMQYQSKLWIEDNNSVWANSSLEVTNIEVSVYPPSDPGFDYFCISGVNDYDMNGTYFNTIGVGVGISNDPDGGVVTHNLTLHYDNETFVAVINNTFTNEDANGGALLCVDFDTSSYYSEEWNYTLMINATDDDGDSVTAWLGVNFSLSNRPIIESYTPDTPHSAVRGDLNTFEISVNQEINVSWYVDGESVSNETGVETSSYDDYGTVVGTYNVTAIITNENGTRQMVWEFIVEDPIMEELEKIQKTQTLLQALVFLCIAVVVGVVSQQRRRKDD